MTLFVVTKWRPRRTSAWRYTLVILSDSPPYLQWAILCRLAKSICKFEHKMIQFFIPCLHIFVLIIFWRFYRIFLLFERKNDLIILPFEILTDCGHAEWFVHLFWHSVRKLWCLQSTFSKYSIHMIKFILLHCLNSSPLIKYEKFDQF